jgi:hypothetical protein
MIDKENLTELSTIQDLIIRKVFIKHNDTDNYMVEILLEALQDALKSDGHIRQNISIVMAKFPALHGYLIDVVNREYPEYNNFIQKLSVLI